MILTTSTRRVARLTGVAGVLSIVTLVLFFTGLFQNIPLLESMGAVNDVLNAITGLLSAVLASMLYPLLRQEMPRLSPFVLIGVWIGALMIGIGTWLIQSGRAEVELSSYYFFFGNGLIGFWLFVFNRSARKNKGWSGRLTGLGLTASLFMMVGLLSLYGILQGLDGRDYPPLLMVSGIGYLGIGILYPVWCLKLSVEH